MSATSARAPVDPRPAKRGRARYGLFLIGALLFLVEEWLLRAFARVIRWLDAMPALRWFESRLARLPAFIALAVLLVPVALLFPVKIMGLWMIGNGRFVGGCCVMLAAKLLSTAIVARIFIACRPQLMTMEWFARLHAWLLEVRDQVHRWIEEQPAWHAVRRASRRARAAVWAWSHGMSVARATSSGAIRRGSLLRWRARRKAQRQRDLGSQSPR